MILLFLSELFLLFILSRRLTAELSFFLYNLFRSRKIATWVMAIIFMPGTIVHELSHALVAKLLFVYVGRIEFIPELSGESLKLGSVEVGKTDLVRNFFIGTAPFFVGTFLVLIILYHFLLNDMLGLNLITVAVLYIMFVISNTMYSSTRDMQGAVQFFAMAIIFSAMLYFLGVRIPGLAWQALNSESVDSFFSMGSVYLGVPLLLDIGVIMFTAILKR